MAWLVAVIAWFCFLAMGMPDDHTGSRLWGAKAVQHRLWPHAQGRYALNSAFDVSDLLITYDRGAADKQDGDENTASQPPPVAPRAWAFGARGGGRGTRAGAETHERYRQRVAVQTRRFRTESVFGLLENKVDRQENTVATTPLNN